jgi:hypothetical protein
MPTTHHGGDDGGDDGDFEPSLPREGAGLDPRRRAGTLAAIGIAFVAGWLLVGNAAGGGPDPDAAPSTSGRSATPTLRAGTYRLPGLSVPVSITVPEGWFAGDSVWGPAGNGVAAVSTGRRGAGISIAVFDLETLRPVDAGDDRSRGRPGDLQWFARSLEDYEARVVSRVRDNVVGRRLDWRPPPVLAWILSHTDRGLIDVADDVVYDGWRGDLVTFAFPGPAQPVFHMPGSGRIELRPGTSYAFWLPRGRGAPNLMLGVARELGAVPDAADWDVVRTLEFGL